MSDEPLPLPDDDTAAPADPFEAELVAYLDGELDHVAARKVEVRLASDPAAREKAAALKKTYDLLDYLPKPEPSPTFTTRTLDKLPAITSNAAAAQSSTKAAHASTLPAARSTSQPVLLSGAVSSSVPVVLTTGAHSLPSAPSSRRWLWAAGILVAVAGFATAGYFGAAALRLHLFPASPPRDAVQDETPLSDRRLVENLPLYSAADDIDFVQKLAEPDYFGDEMSVSFNANPKVPAVDPDKLSDTAFEMLAKSFKALPPARQQAIRDLDRQLFALDKDPRDRLIRALETYVAWLDRLPDAERKGVLAAATPGLRLAAIRDIRERQWLDSLPAAQRNQLTGLNTTKRNELIQQWKDDEARRRDLWAFVRRHADAIATNKAPWPFDTEAGRKEILDYVRLAFRTDDMKRCRLNPYERESLAVAEKNGEWAWYGKTLYELARNHEMLPEPADSTKMYQDFGELPLPYLARLNERPGLRKKLTPHAGKWPEFPLELHEELRSGKFGPGMLPPLGPARMSDFKEPVREFWSKELSPKLSDKEKGGLRMLENRWPEYPREFMRLARQHEMSVPGVTLPGPPKKWNEIYGGSRAKP